MPSAIYLVQTNNGHTWETDAELHEPHLAAKHKHELQLEFDYPAGEVRIMAFEGGDWHGAWQAYEAMREQGKGLGRKAAARLREEYGLTACGFLSVQIAYMCKVI